MQEYTAPTIELVGALREVTLGEGFGHGHGHDGGDRRHTFSH